MNPVLVVNERTENKAKNKVNQAELSTLVPQTILVASVDDDIRAGLTDLLDGTEVEVIYVSSVKDVKSVIAKKNISACLCSFWLQDGTYREIIRHLRQGRMDIPAIIVSSPKCPQEIREYLAAMDLGVLDVLSFPFDQSEFDRMLGFAIPARSLAVQPEQVEQETAQFEVRGAA